MPDKKCLPVPTSGGPNIVRQSAPLARRGMEALQKGRGRLLRFPAEPIGEYGLFSDPQATRGVSGPACGEVYVPVGWEVVLVLRDAKAFRHLASLDPSDLIDLRHVLRFDGDHRDYPDDESMKFVGRLSGLRRLWLSGLMLSGVEFSWLRHLHVLQSLHLELFYQPRRYPGTIIQNLSENAPLTDLDLGQFRLGESHLYRLRKYAHLAELRFEYERTNGIGFRKLASLFRLERLEVAYGGEDKDFAVLDALPRLRRLQLPESVTSGVGIHLRKLRNLEHLRLTRSSVSYAILRDLAKLEALSELDISFTQVQGELDAIAELPLRTLNLWSLPLTDVHVRPIRRLGTLEDLRLNNTQVTDAIGPILAPLSRLRILHLANTEVTDRTLEFLADLPDLRRLDVSETSVSEEAAQRLCRVIPRLIVQRSDFLLGSSWEVRGELAIGKFFDRG